MDEAGELMAKVDLPYVQRFRDRHGKVRHYFRKPGHKRVALPGEPSSPQFMAAYQTALGKAEKRPVGVAQTKPGTLGELLTKFYLSDYWLNTLKPNTQANYRNILERVRADYGHNRVADLTKANVQDMLDERVKTPGAARSFLKRMRTLFDFAIQRDYRADNPFRQVALSKLETEGFRAWTDEDIAAFERKWPAGSRARRALYLLLYTAQRRSDVVRMGRQHVTGGKIKITQVKGRRGKPPVQLVIPIHPDLQAELDRAPAGDMLFLMTAQGKGFSPAGFTSWFVGCAKAADLDGLGPHGLRKAGARQHAEAGSSASQIAAVTGHQTLGEVARYTKSADQERLAEAAMDKLRKAKRRTRSVKPR